MRERAAQDAGRTQPASRRQPAARKQPASGHDVGDHEAGSADVVVVGAGPTGLMLAIELCLGGIRPVVVDALPEISEVPKGNGLIGHIVTVLDYRGLLEPFRAEATYVGPVPGFFFGPLNLQFSRLGSSPLQVLAMPQRQIERKLTERLRQLGGSVRRGHELTQLVQDADAVTLDVRGPGGGYQLRTRYLVGCDGAHSLVRKQAGIEFPGSTSASISRIGRVMLPAGTIVRGTGEVEVPGYGRLRSAQPVRTPRGTYTIAPLTALDKAARPGSYIVSTQEEDQDIDLSAAMTLAELQASFGRVLGADLPMSEPRWLTRIVGNSRQAERYRAGRILLAGDAAHVFGLGGSLNAGLLDAVNLGWKLAAQVRGWAPGTLLDSYHAERHAAGRRTLLQSRAQRALMADGEYVAALRELLGELLEYREPLRHLGQLMAGDDLRFDMASSQSHPLIGWFVPDLEVETAGRRTRVAELMRAARPVLLDLTSGDRVAAAAADWADRVPFMVAEPLTGTPPADALLIRPDGYVAWAIGPDAADQAAGLRAALTAWCGSPS
jgi:2-polyprenyl-6-methoxyphenol hydroxylase-like FAD-dependent oxidoreductase